MKKRNTTFILSLTGSFPSLVFASAWAEIPPEAPGWKRTAIACSENFVGSGAPSIRRGDISRAYLKAIASQGRNGWAGVFLVSGGVFGRDRWIGPLYFETKPSANALDLNLEPLRVNGSEAPIQSAKLEYDTAFSDFVLARRPNDTRSILCQNVDGLDYYLRWDSTPGAKENIAELLKIR